MYNIKLFIFMFLMCPKLLASKCSDLHLLLSSVDDDGLSEVSQCYPRCHTKKIMAKKPTNYKGTDALRRHNDEVISIVKGLKLTREQQRRLHDEITGKHLTREEVIAIASDLFKH